MGVFWGEFKERECREGKVCSEEMVLVAIGKQNEKLVTRIQISGLLKIMLRVILVLLKVLRRMKV